MADRSRFPIFPLMRQHLSVIEVDSGFPVMQPVSLSPSVCLALTAGLNKLIIVNCVPLLHNQLMWLRRVRCAPQHLCVPSTCFNNRVNKFRLTFIIIFEVLNLL
ncbi:hypothetical protein XENOCAPTIV_002068 [Xenoophorus captivus]|uniref:Uncharacterized protein n=1 Tax=Xenoophorus captivus TaxID=1517983 RepID=A0ABV0R6C2_9TELE